MKFHLTRAVLFLFLVKVGVTAELSLPLEKTLTISPGTTMGFELNETTIFEFLQFSGTIDCLSYNFTGTKPLSAAIWFQHWSHIREYSINNSVPPVHEGVVPHSWCNMTTKCGIHFEAGELPKIEGRFRSSLVPVPYTVVFWYDLSNQGMNDVNLTVDAPCYTGEPEIFSFPLVPVPPANNSTSSSP